MRLATTKERPILFNTEGVRALIAGEKTQTRRVVKGDYSICPYGKDGDELWVRETFRYFSSQFGVPGGVVYKADHPNDSESKWKPSIFMSRKLSRIQLIIKSVKFEKLQNITTQDIWNEGIRVRLNEGSDPCRPEKWDEWNEQEKEKHLYHVARATYMSQCDDIDRLHKVWETLWDSINKKRGFGWDKNPFVWVVEFEPTDELGAWLEDDKK